MPKAELIPTILYAEGRPRDVGTDRALANALNVFHDSKSAHQSPWLSRTNYFMNSNDSSLRIWPVFFGTEHVSATVERFATVAPWIRSSTGDLCTFTITLTDTLPSYKPGYDFTGAIYQPQFSGKYEQATWTTSSSTWATGADATLSLGVKDLELGFAFLVIEAAGGSPGTGAAQCRGLAKLIEGARVIT
jgi:hypothetical protein